MDQMQDMLQKARRAQILDAAITVFAEKGFHRATIKDIARQAGVADGTIYTYFANKQELLLGILDRLNESDQRAMQFTLPETMDLRHFTIAYMQHRVHTLWPNLKALQAVLPELLVNPHLQETYRREILEPTIKIAEIFFQNQMEQGRIRTVDIPLTVRAIAGSFFGLILLQLLGDQVIEQRHDAIPETLGSLFLDGLQEQHDD